MISSRYSVHSSSSSTVVGRVGWRGGGGAIAPGLRMEAAIRVCAPARRACAVYASSHVMSPVQKALPDGRQTARTPVVILVKLFYPRQESERIYSDERLSQRLSKSFKVFDGSAKSFPSRVCHASCCLGGLGHSDNSGTDPKHPRKCRFCTKVLPDDAVVAR